MDVNTLDNSGLHPKVGLKKSFYKAILASLTATSVDFSVSIIFANILNVYYPIANVIGGLSGAVASFFISRIWVFKKKADKLSNQMIKFFITNTISIFLNTSVVYFVKETFDFMFETSKLISAVFVGFFFNYFMNKYFVFNTWQRKK